MQAAMGEVDGVPAQRHQLGRPQAVPVGDQHHGGVAVAIAVLAGGSDQASDLAIGEVLARADLGVASPRGGSGDRNCPNNGGWRHQRQMRICHGFSGFSSCYCPYNGPSWDTAQGEKRRFYGHNCDLGRGGRTGQHARDAELAGIFCRWATDATAAMARGHAQWRTAIHRRDFFEARASRPACRSAFSRISPSAFAAAQVGPTPGMARNRVGPFGSTSRKASTMTSASREPT